MRGGKHNVYLLCHFDQNAYLVLLHIFYFFAESSYVFICFKSICLYFLEYFRNSYFKVSQLIVMSMSTCCWCLLIMFSHVS